MIQETDLQSPLSLAAGKLGLSRLDEREQRRRAVVQLDPDPAGLAGRHPQLVARRGHQAGDHQLPLVQAREGRPVLREDLRPGQGLGVQLRQVQAHPLPRRDLRPLRRRGHPGQGAPRAARSHRAGGAGLAHLVLQGRAVAHRPPARHEHPRPRAHPLLRVVRGDRAGQDRLQEARDHHRGPVQRGHGRAAGLRPQGQDGRRGDPRPARRARPRGAVRPTCAPRPRSRPRCSARRSSSSACASSRRSATAATGRSG